MTNFWRLVEADTAQHTIAHAHHNPWLSCLAVALAILAAGVFLSVARRYRYGNPKWRLAWLAMGSCAMGIGVWAMHFTAMLGMQLPFAVEYDLALTLASLAPALLASGYFLAKYTPGRKNFAYLNKCALSLAAGIGGMHYLGMEAIRAPATMYYQPGYFALSLVAAYLSALAGIYAHAITHKNGRISPNTGVLVGSVFLGAAVSAMHYTAMHATWFAAVDHALHAAQPLDQYDLVGIISAATALLLGLILVAAQFDRHLSRLSRSLKQSELRFSRLADSTPALICTFDGEQITYANRALCELMGVGAELMEDSSLEQVFGENFSSYATSLLLAGKDDEEAAQQQFEIVTAVGDTRWLYFSFTPIEIENRQMGLASGFDITEQKIAENSLLELAYNDHLTQIPNRALFLDRLDHHLRTIARRGGDGDSCIILVDLDGFKDVNDSLGHQAGDRLLNAVAMRLKTVGRASDTFARLGGDEFIYLFENLDSHASAALLAENIMQEFASPFEIEERAVELDVSLGVLTLSPNSYQSADKVLRDADIALYRAKSREGSNWILFDEALNISSRRERQLRTELIEAVKDGCLALHYQPIIDSKNNLTLGFESLSRWQRLDGEWVSPGEFIPIAERCGIVSDIGIWALRTAASQLHEWTSEFLQRDIYVSVNIAAVSFEDERFLDALKEIISEYDFNPGQIKLELTESILMKNMESMIPRLQEIKALGCEIMLDDFGTGYSSLAYLHKLPISTLKIDRSFVAEIQECDQTVLVVNSILRLAATLNMKVISEGVETNEQVLLLKELGCDWMQGYLFSRPLSVAQAEKFLADEQSRELSKAG